LIDYLSFQNILPLISNHDSKCVVWNSTDSKIHVLDIQRMVWIYLIILKENNQGKKKMYLQF